MPVYAAPPGAPYPFVYHEGGDYRHFDPGVFVSVPVTYFPPKEAPMVKNIVYLCGETYSVMEADNYSPCRGASCRIVWSLTDAPLGILNLPDLDDSDAAIAERARRKKARLDNANAAYDAAIDAIARRKETPKTMYRYLITFRGSGMTESLFSAQVEGASEADAAAKFLAIKDGKDGNYAYLRKNSGQGTVLVTRILDADDGREVTTRAFTIDTPAPVTPKPTVTRIDRPYTLLTSSKDFF